MIKRYCWCDWLTPCAYALQERSRQLEAARDELEKESEELHRTAQALEDTQEELRVSTAALKLTAADNEKLVAQVEEARELLLEAQVDSPRYLCGIGASPEKTMRSIVFRISDLLGQHTN